MPVYQHLLITTDLSAIAPTIIQRAHELASLYRAKLSILHVINHSALAYGGGFSIPIAPNLEQQLETCAKTYLEQLSSQADIPPSQQFITNGSIKNDVCETAKQQHVDLIIIGSYHHSTLNSLLGSQANAIVHHAPCDVLNIKIHENHD